MIKSGARSMSLDLAGRVTVDFIVDSTGNIRSCSLVVITATDSRLIPEALAILADARFIPGQAEGRPISVWVRQTIPFKPHRRAEH